MKKAIIASIVLVLGGLIGFKAYQAHNPEKFPETTVSTPAPSETSTSPSVASTPSDHVDVIVTPPINGIPKGVIEVGASGFNSFVVSIDKDKNWELISKEFGESLAYEGFATTTDVKLGLKKYLGNIFNKGVAGRNMHFVISSGALKNAKTEIIAKAIEEDGYVVNRVTPEQEGKYALRALLSPQYRTNSFVVDIGSGNTKVSWYEGNTLKSMEGPGAKYYQAGKTDSQVFQEIQGIVMQVPAANRVNCFIIGGVPYKLAEQGRNTGARFTILKAPEDYSAGDDVKIKSGLNIYRALREGSGCNNFIFDWDANFTIGFLLTLN